MCKPADAYLTVQAENRQKPSSMTQSRNLYSVNRHGSKPGSQARKANLTKGQTREASGKIRQTGNRNAGMLI